MKSLSGVIKFKKTRKGIKFLAVTVEEKEINEFLFQLKCYLGDALYKHIRDRKIYRDGNKFHITVVPPHEMKKLNIDNECIKVEFNLMGVGTIDDEVFFIVIESDELDSFRKKHKLKKYDFHITLGFINRDIHGVSKTINTLIEE